MGARLRRKAVTGSVYDEVSIARVGELEFARGRALDKPNQII